MPQVFKIGSYWVFFWTNENEPLEPIHVHVCEGRIIESQSSLLIKAWLEYFGEISYFC